MGVMLLLEELKEVSNVTADCVKYICNHRVTGRLRLHTVANPEALESRETYLKVRGTLINVRELTDSKDKEEEGGSDGQEHQPEAHIGAEVGASCQLLFFWEQEKKLSLIS